MITVGRGEVETVARTATVITVREGKITHMNSFQSKADALEAAGLRE